MPKLSQNPPEFKIISTIFDSHIHHRRSIRLQGYDYTQPMIYFITICTHERIPLFGDIHDDKMRLNSLGRIAEAEWLRLPARFPFLEPAPFIVMPNHVHGLLVIARERSEEGARRPNSESRRVRSTALPQRADSKIRINRTPALPTAHNP